MLIQLGNNRIWRGNLNVIFDADERQKKATRQLEWLSIISIINADS